MFMYYTMNKGVRNTTKNVGIVLIALLALIVLQGTMTPKKKPEKYCSACGGR